MQSTAAARRSTADCAPPVDPNYVGFSAPPIRRFEQDHRPGRDSHL